MCNLIIALNPLDILTTHSMTLGDKNNTGGSRLVYTAKNVLIAAFRM